MNICRFFELICELYWRIRFKNRQILDVFWTLLVNLICELYWRIRFTNKVKKSGRYLTLFVNCIYSINICRFFNLICEPYSPVQFTNKVQKTSRICRFFEPYSPIQFTNKVQKTGRYSSNKYIKVTKITYRQNVCVLSPMTHRFCL